MSSLMHKPTGPASQTIDAQAANLRRNATANPAFKPEFRRSLRMHPTLAGAVATLVLLALVIFALRQKAMYYAESLIYIEPFNTKVLADGNPSGFDSTKYESSVAQQMLTAQRADILTTALATLPRQVWSFYGPTPQAAAGALQGQMKVARVTSSYQVAIGLKGPDAANTAAIVNAVTRTYLEAGRKDEISQADQRSQLLSEERSRIEAELAKTRAEQTRLGATLGVADPGIGTTNPYDSQLDALRQQLVQARGSHDQAAAQLAAISGGSGVHSSGLTAAANDIIVNDPGLGSMKATINQRRAQLASQMADLKPANPIYKADQDELADLDKTLESMTVQLRDRAARTLQDKLRTELERTSDVEGRLNGELARQTASATNASPRLQRAQELAADVQRLTARYAIVDNALHSLQLETTGPGMAHLALAATVPVAPEPTKQRLILLAALPLALLAGLSAAVFARKRDHHIYTAVDVDDVLGFAPIAILPARSEVSREVLDEYYLRLAAGVEGAYRSGNARTFVITPVSPETDIAPLVQALDRKLMELGLGVAVMEAETIFESNPAAAGTHLDPASSPAFDRHFEGLAPAMFSRMKAEHDVILLESPALLTSAHTEYVARCSDVTLLVAESAVTTRGELYQAGVLLQRLNVTGVGAVLEQLQLRFASSTFAKGVRTVEGRSRPVRPVVVADKRAPVVVLEPEPEPMHFEAETEPLLAQEWLAAEPIPSAEPTISAWYPEHAVPTPEAPDLKPDVEPAPEMAAELEPTADFQEREHPAPMALFDAIEPTPKRSRSDNNGSPSGSSSPLDESEPAPTPERSWFQRVLQRDAQPVVSIVPERTEQPAHSDDWKDQEHAVPVPAASAYDASRYDLPLPVEPEPTREYVPEPAVLAAPMHFVGSVADAQAVPLEQRMDAPMPDPSTPISSIPPLEEPLEPLEPLEAYAPALAPAYVEPDYVAPSEIEPSDAAFVAPGPASVAFVVAEPIPYAMEPAAVAEPVRRGPARPLSYQELTQLSQSAPAAPEPLPAPPDPATFQHFEAAVEPEARPPFLDLPIAELPLAEPVALQKEFDPVAYAPEPIAEPGYAEPVLSAELDTEPTHAVLQAEPVPPPAPMAEEWNPTPLNRWDPIPQLRPQEEPWRISSGSRMAHPQPSSRRDVWRGEQTEDTVRIPPVDRWVPAESLPADAPPAESNDVVLTRRWGLLSRFQQGESFQATHRPAARMEPGREPDQYAQDFGQEHEPDPEHDRQRR